jgi:CPA2 family monovalent cation:H+ antiporter-2
MQISVDFLGHHIVSIVSIMTVVMLLKAVIIFAFLVVFKSSADSLRSAIALSQVGEFSFVVLELARISGITSKEINQTLIIAVVLSMMLTPFIVRNLQRLVSLLTRSEEYRYEPMRSFEGSSHIVVLGYGSLGQWVCKELKTRGLSCIAIDNKRKRVEESRRNADLFILGNAHQEDILRHANISNAASVIIAVENDLKTLSLAESVLRMAPHANIIVSGRDDASVLREDKRIHSFVHEHSELSKSMVTKAVSCPLKYENLSKER